MFELFVLLLFPTLACPFLFVLEMFLRRVVEVVNCTNVLREENAFFLASNTLLQSFIVEASFMNDFFGENILLSISKTFFMQGLEMGCVKDFLGVKTPRILTLLAAGAEESA